MNFGKFSFLISVIIFGGLAILIEYFRHKEYFVKYRRLIIGSIFVLPIFAIVADSLALRWRIWEYVPESTSGIYFGTILENMLFAIVVFIAVAIPTLVAADRIDMAKRSIKDKRN